MLNVALVGVGYWGPKLARSLENTGKVRITRICDLSPQRLDAMSEVHPGIAKSTAISDILDDDSIDAVAISTPTATHHDLARAVLEADKHVLVEKPLATRSEEVESLIKLAQARDRVLMVGHVFEYSATIIELKSLIDSGELGEIYQLRFERTNLGPIRTDVSALWDLASHDISILYFLLGRDPREINAFGESFLDPELNDMALVNLRFEGGPVVNIHVSWLFPSKVRQIIVVGSKKMVIWDDLDMEAPIRIFDVKQRLGEETGISETIWDHKIHGLSKAFTPEVEQNEPLLAECEHFVDCILHGSPPRTDGYNAYRVVRLLEKVTESIRSGGKTIHFNGKTGA